jgi:beta-phosphoglucomutase-like phosphatase (HAD superfamily)
MGIEHVFLDIGGVLYDDRVYAEAWRLALREAGATFTDDAFDEEYAACRAGQDRSFRVRLATAFLGPDVDLEIGRIRRERSTPMSSRPSRRCVRRATGSV